MRPPLALGLAALLMPPAPATCAPPSAPSSAPEPVDLSREGLRKRLKALERRALEAPWEPRRAMCYAPGEDHRPEGILYVCPVCCLRTCHPVPRPLDLRIALLMELDRLRSAALQVRGLVVTLDERTYCGHCRPDDPPGQLEAIVTWPDGRQVRSALFGSVELERLAALTRGEAFLPFDLDRRPLGLDAPDLRKLLGLPPEVP